MATPPSGRSVPSPRNLGEPGEQVSPRLLRFQWKVLHNEERSKLYRLRTVKIAQPKHGGGRTFVHLRTGRVSASFLFYE